MDYLEWIGYTDSFRNRQIRYFVWKYRIGRIEGFVYSLARESAQGHFGTPAFVPICIVDHLVLCPFLYTESGNNIRDHLLGHIC